MTRWLVLSGLILGLGCEQAQPSGGHHESNPWIRLDPEVQPAPPRIHPNDRPHGQGGNERRGTDR